MIGNLTIWLVDPPFWFEVLTKTTLCLAFAWLFVLVLRERNPRWRILVWRCTAVAVVLIPFMSLTSGAIRLPVRVAEPVRSAPPLASSPDGPAFERDATNILGGLDAAQTARDAEATAEKSGLELDLLPDASERIASTPSKLRTLLLTLWGVIAALLTVRMFASVLRVRAIVTHSSLAPKDCRQLLYDVGAELRSTRHVELRCTEEITGPFLTGMRTPIIVLPQEMVEPEYRTDLRGVLAHELMHVNSHDLFWMGVMRWLSLPFWFHPLMWKVREVHATACEQVCDSEAASYVGDVATYSRTIAQIALKVTGWSPSSAAVPMARTSEVMGRLATLRGMLSSPPLNRRQIAASICLATLMGTTLGTLEVVRADRLASVHASGMSLRHVWDMPAWGTPSGPLSAGGRFLSYEAWEFGNLAVHDFQTNTDQLVTNNSYWAETGGWEEASIISPDGSRIVYSWNDESGTGAYELRVIDRDGSNMRILHKSDDVYWIKPFDWAGDGSQVLAVFWSSSNSVGKLVTVSLVDGAVRTLRTWTKEQGLPQNAAFSPNGAYAAYDMTQAGSADRDIFIFDLVANTEEPLVNHPANDEFVDWAPHGNRILFTTTRTQTPSLWLISVVEGKPEGAPIRLKDDFEGVPVGMSAGGSLYFARATGNHQVHLGVLDPVGGGLEGQPTVASSFHFGATVHGDWSPDGKFLAMRVASTGWSGTPGPGTFAFVILSLETGRERTLTLTQPFRYARRLEGPWWSPDGKALVVRGVGVQDGPGIYTIDVASGATKMLVSGSVFGPRFSPDGRHLYFARRQRTKPGGVLVRRDLTTAEETVIYEGAETANGRNLSPDGLQFSFRRPDGSMVVASIATGEQRELLRIAPDQRNTAGASDFLIWSSDGNYLLFCKRNNELWRVQVETGEQQRIVSEFGTVIGQTSMHSDGKRIVITADHGSSVEVWAMEDFLP
ncbi:MAG: PD40 domain-containing protein [Planctomycetes bacterium]|nr:PD40 domain-containing protein [Planctomycetota bacterium]